MDIAECQDNVDFSNAAIDRIGEVLRIGSFTNTELIALDGYRRNFERVYDYATKLIRHDLRKDGVTGRPCKSTRAIIEKLRRGTLRLSQMQDIAGCRVIVDDIPSQDRLVNAIKVFCPQDVRIYDRRKKPSFGYRAVHVVLKQESCGVEIQIRTVPQHLWAEISEKLADLNPGIKYGEGEPSLLKALDSLSVAIANLENEESDRHEALLEWKDKMHLLPKPHRKKFKKLNTRFLRRRDRLVNSLSNIKNIINKLD